MKGFLSLSAASAFLVASSVHSQEFVAYQIEAGQAGNQSATVSLGLDFNLTSDITVNRLGCFDDDADGLINTITVELWSRNDGTTPEDRADDTAGTLLASLSFDSAAPGTLDGGHRFKDLLAPVDLAAGSYTIMAFGFGADDRNYNTNTAPGFAPLSNEDAGVLEFIGRRYGPTGAYPVTVDGGINARYAAGTFAFELRDSDDDGMPDFWEVLYSLNPNDDSDAGGNLDEDTLTNLEEYNAGTFPNNSDSDDDGSDDDDELTNGTDPTNPDSDFDGLEDGIEDHSGTFTDEESTGTDPQNIDTDNDGYDDGAEVELLSDPTDGDSTPRSNFGEPAYAIVKGREGNQTAPSSLGMDFDVDGKISIGHLGAFDENSDGFANPITVEIWERNNNGTPEDPLDDTGVGFAPIAQISINPGEGFLQGSNRFKALPVPLLIDADIDPSSYTIVAYGFSADDRNYNTFGGVPADLGLTLSSNIAVNFVGLSRYASGGATGVFPDIVDGGSANRYAAGTFAFTAEDADGDGMPDFWEILNGLNPNSAADAALDGDNDDLSNLEEFQNNLDPADADSDDDNLNDGAELLAGTDPRNSDTDGDTISDGTEVIDGTSPLLPDTDGDDFTDNHEVDAGTNPNDINEFPSVSSQGTIAYLANAGAVGNQTNFAGSAGMDFVVNDNIVITELGVFDSAGDGFIGELTVQLWQRNEAGTPDFFGDDSGDSVLAQLTFGPANRGLLRDGHRTQALTAPLLLTPGTYSIVASGFGINDPMGNQGQVNPPSLSNITDPAVTFVGSGRYIGTPVTFPTNADGGPENRYAAGTFSFSVPSGVPVITDFVWDSNTGKGSLTFTSLPGNDYEIEYSENMTSWLGIDDLVATSSVTNFQISSHPQPGAGVLFFRAVKLE
ncbi:hypothetical protein N9A94_05550 [Akkermansiaceae bacterium]|nr:hypothetical protein [Akkermansiaceae bacterium]MDA7888262.1 hypothetical protein [Akkermansiaceae bacterium]MDB4544600.1 hypothetical protein [Akkermansiaceae bacterium]